jgi:hypothetical protein
LHNFTFLDFVVFDFARLDITRFYDGCEKQLVFISVFFNEGLSYSDFVLYDGTVDLYFGNIIGCLFIFTRDSGIEGASIRSFA